MGALEKPLVTQSIPFKEIEAELRGTRIFAEADFHALEGMGKVERVLVSAGSVLSEPGDSAQFYWVVLRGETRAERLEADGSRIVVGGARAGTALARRHFCPENPKSASVPLRSRIRS